AGNSEAARRRLEDAAAAWAQAGMPFEEAETRLALAQHARSRADAAHERSRALRSCARSAARREPNERRTRKARSRSLRVRSRFSAWWATLERRRDRRAARGQPHTIHRHVANIRTKLRESSRAAAAAHAARAGLI
ncbi:MAG: hypothetical protein M3550_04765, partial [Actinomycetota bacterium]|nr:hypothetical protein [Actinomycetota bacterium]